VMLCTQTPQDLCHKPARRLDCLLASHLQWPQFGCVCFVCVCVRVPTKAGSSQLQFCLWDLDHSLTGNEPIRSVYYRLCDKF